MALTRLMRPHLWSLGCKEGPLNIASVRAMRQRRVTESETTTYRLWGTTRRLPAMCACRRIYELLSPFICASITAVVAAACVLIYLQMGGAATITPSHSKAPK